MIYKYGSLPSQQLKNQKIYLQKSIFQMIPYREEGYKYLDNRFVSLLQYLNGLNRLIGEQPVIITIMSLLEFARNENDFKQYRKAILDAVALIDQIEDGDSDV